MSQREDGKYWNGVGKYSLLSDKLYDALIPRSGSAYTESGELLRAASKLYYRMFNDGDNFDTFWKEWIEPDCKKEESERLYPKLNICDHDWLHSWDELLYGSFYERTFLAKEMRFEYLYDDMMEAVILRVAQRSLGECEEGCDCPRYYPISEDLSICECQHDALTHVIKL